MALIAFGFFAEMTPIWFLVVVESDISGYKRRVDAKLNEHFRPENSAFQIKDIFPTKSKPFLLLNFFIFILCILKLQ